MKQRCAPVLRAFLARFFFFFVFETFNLFYFYIIASRRSLSDGALLAILRLVIFSGLAAACYAVWCLLSGTVAGVVELRRGGKFPLRLALTSPAYIACGAASLALAAVAAFVTIAARGNMGM